MCNFLFISSPPGSNFVENRWYSYNCFCVSSLCYSRFEPSKMWMTAGWLDRSSKKVNQSNSMDITQRTNKTRLAIWPYLPVYISHLSFENNFPPRFINMIEFINVFFFFFFIFPFLSPTFRRLHIWNICWHFILVNLIYIDALEITLSVGLRICWLYPPSQRNKTSIQLSVKRLLE